MIGHLDQLEKKVLTSSEVKNASIKVLVSPKEGWDGYVMRVLEVEKEGYTPKHQHPWPHINYIIEGDAELMIDGKVEKITAGSYAYIPGDTIHQFRNVGDKTFKFICIVPEEGHK
jgi:quercetin dioxygenase-like cupin family protein